MATSILARMGLFLSSYSPLFLILGLRNSFGNEIVRYGMVGLSILSVALLAIYLLLAGTQSPHIVQVRSATPRDSDAMSYMVSYLLPFLDVSFDDVANAASLGLILVVLAVLYVHSNMIFINPILNLAGYHILEIETEAGKLNAVITRSSYVRPGQTLSVVSLGDYVLKVKNP